MKQRMQAGQSASVSATLQSIFKHENGLRGLYGGYGITLLREIPFSFIQFPLYEFLKVCSMVDLCYFLFSGYCCSLI